jgi:uncharacterized protein YfaQ (DUF2300 family)
LLGLVVPGQIVVAVVAELRVYRFLGCEERFAELLRILEKKCECGGRDDENRVCCRIGATNGATRRGVGRSVRGAVRIGEVVAELARRIWLQSMSGRMVVAVVAELA